MLFANSSLVDGLTLCSAITLIQIKWSNRFKGSATHKRNRSLVTVDGTDYRISEPVPFSSCWYSQKFHGAGLRYEVAVNISTGDIVHYNGPFAPKGNPDICIFRFKLRDMLSPGEQVLADKGYKGDTRVCTPYDSKDDDHRKAMSHARCRHETVNRRLKQWGILGNKFRHHRTKHCSVFEAVAVLTQLSFDCGDKPWQIRDTVYSDPMY